MRLPLGVLALALLVGCDVLTTDPPDDLPGDTIQVDSIPRDTIPADTIPRDTIPRDTIPRDTIPRDTIPRDTIPRDTIPRDTIPRDTIPRDTIPRDTIPRDTIPRDTIPADTIPVDTIPVGPQPAPDTLSAITFNILHDAARPLSNVPAWDGRRDLVARTIGDASADIVGLQEAYMWQVDWLKEQLPQYGSVGRGREANGGGESVSILFDRRRFDVEEQGHFWLSPTPDVPGSVGGEAWGGTQVPRIVTWARLGLVDGGQVYVYNTHLPSSDEIGGEVARRRGVLVLADRIASRSLADVPYVLLGDFNSTESQFPIRYLTGREPCSQDCGGAGGYAPVTSIDTWRIMNAGTAGTRCRNTSSGPTTFGDRIDYVLVADSVRDDGDSAPTRVLGSRVIVPESCPSDHVPVLSRFVFPDF